MMMSNPDVSYTRPTHPDKVPRPPPKSFTDFQSAADAAKNPDSVKQSFIPKPGHTEPSSPHGAGGEGFSQADVRMSLLEQRIEQLEGELEELTEAATKPAPQSSSSATFVARLVRLAVVDAMISPEAALLAIAQELGIVETARSATPSASFRPPTVAAKPPPVTRAARTPEPEEEPSEPSEPPGKRHAGRPSDAMRKAQEGPRKAINALLAANGISQSKVAKAGGFTQTALSRWLRGGVTFDPTFIPKVEKAIKKLV